MQPREFVGNNTEDALQKACEHFDLPLNRLDVEVITAGSSGFLGLLGAKKAKVLVKPLEGGAEEDVAEVMKELTGETGTPARKPASRPQDSRQADDSQAQDAPTARIEENPEVVEAAKEVLAKLLTHLDGDATIQAKGGPYGIQLDVDGGEIGILIGRRGQTLEALQYLTTRIVSHQQGRPVRIHLDAGGYKRRRRESLEDLARRMAQKARSTGRPQVVGPFNSQERRLVHLALRHEDGLTTNSRGRGELKKVIIAPKD